MIIGRYFFLGLGLSFAGTTMSVVSFFLAHLVPITALGLAAVIVGVTAISLPEQVSGSYAMKTLLRGTTLGIDPLLVEIEKRRMTASRNEIAKKGITTGSLDDLESDDQESGRDQLKVRAIYLPPKLKEEYGGPKRSSSALAISSAPDEDERSSVYIALSDFVPEGIDVMRAAPTELLSEDEAQQGIRVFTAGAYLGQIEEIRDRDVTIEDALNYILVESAELCSSIRAYEIEDTIVLEIDDVKVESETQTYRNLLGSLPTSLATSAISAMKKAPLVVTNEDITPTKTVARIQVLQGK
jgi:hypothetical protein